MRGSIVIARDYRGSALVRRVWEAGSKLVYLSEETEFNKLLEGQDALRPVGFPLGDVFEYDPQALNGDAIDWNSLHQFHALSRQSQNPKLESVVSSE